MNYAEVVSAIPNASGLTCPRGCSGKFTVATPMKIQAGSARSSLQARSIRDSLWQLRCTKCLAAFTRLHVSKYDRIELPFECVDCSAKFPDVEKLEDHIETKCGLSITQFLTLYFTMSIEELTNMVVFALIESTEIPLCNFAYFGDDWKSCLAFCKRLGKHSYKQDHQVEIDIIRGWDNYVGDGTWDMEPRYTVFKFRLNPEQELDAEHCKTKDLSQMSQRTKDVLLFQNKHLFPNFESVNDFLTKWEAKLKSGGKEMYSERYGVYDKEDSDDDWSWRRREGLD
jgi:hypothetical protein